MSLRRTPLRFTALTSLIVLAAALPISRAHAIEAHTELAAPELELFAGKATTGPDASVRGMSRWDRVPSVQSRLRGPRAAGSGSHPPKKGPSTVP